MNISLMDYFAGQALIGLLAGRVGAENICDFSDVRQGDTTETDEWAHTAYSIAEAMLRAREHEYWNAPNS